MIDGEVLRSGPPKSISSFNLSWFWVPACPALIRPANLINEVEADVMAI
ncbi:hypothetical protein RG47T_2918 [Mucilaginibacter polytrichastri]|uniref:Uncharacterized protein n=2 Tax=Mucilaginibacter polytrichastri TaxID=1302689 RepID=A0A1Q6A0C4_9SPHI|nr:hypothetical protein RG47T_2918 [Mucilaginibacter polytrichastri]